MLTLIKKPVALIVFMSLLMLGTGELVTMVPPSYLLLLISVILLFIFFLFPRGRLFGIYALCLIWWFCLPFGMGPLAPILWGSSIPELLIYMLAVTSIVVKVVSYKGDKQTGSFKPIWIGIFFMLLGGVISWLANLNAGNVSDFIAVSAFRWSTLLPAASLLVFLSQRMTTRQILTGLFLIILGASLMVIFVYVFQGSEFTRLGYLQHNIVPIGGINRSLSFHPVPFGSILAILSPVSLIMAINLRSSVYRIAFACLTLINLIGILFSGTRGALVAVIFGILVALLLNSISFSIKTWIGFIFLLLSAIFVLTLVIRELAPFEWEIIIGRIQSLQSLSAISSDTSVTARLSLLEIGIKLWMQSPLVGLGFGRFLESVGNYEENTYLMEILGAGLFGLLGYVFLLYQVSVLCWRGRRSSSVLIQTISNGSLASVVVILIVGLSDMIFMTPYLAIGTLVLIGLIIRITLASSVPMDREG